MNIRSAFVAAGLLMAGGTIALLPAYGSPFKQLPRNMRVCTADDMVGLFKLRDVFEKQSGGEYLKEFHQAPHQYLFFSKTQNFVMINGSRDYTDAKEMDDELTRRFEREKRQYVLSETGDLYFYQKGKPTDSFVCNIVTKNEPPYKQDEMLLINTSPDGSDVAVKDYERHTYHLGPPPQPAPEDNPPPPPKRRR